MKNVALYENGSKPEAFYWAEKVAEKLLAIGFTVFVRQSLASKLNTDLKNKTKTIQIQEFERYVDAVITLGGDGTVLCAARELLHTEIPIMGINIGKLGFLAEYPVEDLDSALNTFINGNYRIIDRTAIYAEINGEIIYAVNDFIIEKKSTVRLIKIQAYTDDHFVADYRADGLIITTPTGSTAYSLSCNGPIIPPKANVICLTPVAPHTLTLRPLILPDSSILTLSVNSPSGVAGLVSDGSFEKLIKNGEVITIQKSDKCVKMIKPNDTSYFDLLRRKLFWAQNPVAD